MMTMTFLFSCLLGPNPPNSNVSNLILSFPCAICLFCFSLRILLAGGIACVSAVYRSGTSDLYVYQQNPQKTTSTLQHHHHYVEDYSGTATHPVEISLRL